MFVKLVRLHSSFCVTGLMTGVVALKLRSVMFSESSVPEMEASAG